MFHFYNLLNKEKNYYYINTGILIYLFGSTVLFISGNLINTLKLIGDVMGRYMTAGAASAEGPPDGPRSPA
ncbi:MAG: hypothetical protein ABS44_19090 [Chryseobacterium sp. SCN 40-13]|nr:MAG: hypothetical protein ABS44_19090 [Chryseobacterium sp. SCN 40-13]